MTLPLLLVVASNSWCSLALWLHNSNLCLHCYTAFSLCVLSSHTPLYVRPFMSLSVTSYKDTKDWIRAHYNSVWPHFDYLHLWRPYFQIKFLVDINVGRHCSMQYFNIARKKIAWIHHSFFPTSYWMAWNIKQWSSKFRATNKVYFVLHISTSHF